MIRQRYCFETCIIIFEKSGVISVDIKFCAQGAVCPCPMVIYMYKNNQICSLNRFQVRVFRDIAPLQEFARTLARVDNVTKRHVNVEKCEISFYAKIKKYSIVLFDIQDPR